MTSLASDILACISLFSTMVLYTNWNSNALMVEASESFSDNSRDITRSRCTAAGGSFICNNERGSEPG